MSNGQRELKEMLSYKWTFLLLLVFTAMFVSWVAFEWQLTTTRATAVVAAPFVPVLFFFGWLTGNRWFTRCAIGMLVMAIVFWFWNSELMVVDYPVLGG